MWTWNVVGGLLDESGGILVEVVPVVVTATTGLLVLAGVVTGWVFGSLSVLVALTGPGRSSVPGGAPFGTSGDAPMGPGGETPAQIRKFRRLAVQGLGLAVVGAVGFLAVSLPSAVQAGAGVQASVAVGVAIILTVVLVRGLRRRLRSPQVRGVQGEGPQQAEGVSRMSSPGVSGTGV